MGLDEMVAEGVLTEEGSVFHGGYRYESNERDWKIEDGQEVR